MKIGKQFNQLDLKEYQFYIDNHKKYTDFNTLGLYRSIIENEKLTLVEKLELRDYAHTFFQKTFDFLQLKDPKTYIDVCTLGQELTQADKHQLWENVKVNQQKILADKKIKHRNFGIYSIHDCGYDTCPFNGMMIRQGSRLAESSMHFDSDKNHAAATSKSERLKRNRKNQKQIIDEKLEELE
jgi:hypothetical protein